MTLDTVLDDALARLAHNRPFLIALDFDGVLAPIVDDPASARPLPASVAAIDQLLKVDGAIVAYVSGRDLAGLAAASQASSQVHLVGSHGAQWQERLRPADSLVALTDTEQALHALVVEQLEAIAAAHPGTRVEVKPSTAVLHTRVAEPAVAQAATVQALQGPAKLEGVKVTPGKDVVEIAVTHTTKGEAVAWLRDHFKAQAVCFMGDDVTDETVFRTLGPEDLGIKVGPGDTAARFRVDSLVQVSQVLQRAADYASR